MTQRKDARRKSRFLFSLTLLLAVFVDTATPANAAEIVGAITNVSLTTTTVDEFGVVDFDVEWAAPGGSMSGGFFTLTVPPELTIPDGFTFTLMDTTGTDAAVAVVNAGVITFTLTDFVDGLSNVEGTAFISANVDKGQVESGSVHSLSLIHI